MAITQSQKNAVIADLNAITSKVRTLVIEASAQKNAILDYLSAATAKAKSLRSRPRK